MLKYRTPDEVYASSPRPQLDRDAFYGKWLDLYGRLRLKTPCVQSMLSPVCLDFAAMRLVAKAVLQECGLLRFFKSPGGPNV